jgi:cell division protein FtsL
MSNIGAAFGRLSRREKIMVGSLGVTVLFVGLFLFYFFVGRGGTQLQAELKDQQAKLLQLQHETSAYLEKTAEVEQAKNHAMKNKGLNLKNLIYDVAGKISFESRIGGPKRLNDQDVLDLPSGSQTFLKKRSRRSRKNKSSKRGYWRKDQTIKFKTEPTWDAIDALVTKLDAPEQMIYVSSIDLVRYSSRRRRSTDGGEEASDYASKNASITVSAIYYEEDKQ